MRFRRARAGAHAGGVQPAVAWLRYRCSAVRRCCCGWHGDMSRLYCGWLCPTVPVVETINGLMRRANRRPSLWERQPLPRGPAGRRARVPNPGTGCRHCWRYSGSRSCRRSRCCTTCCCRPRSAISSMPIPELRRSLISSARRRSRSISVPVARHLFCRSVAPSACFRSLSWMANDRAMVVGFRCHPRDPLPGLQQCLLDVCPMRLKAAHDQAQMFTCTECAQCISACTTVRVAIPAQPAALGRGRGCPAGGGDRPMAVGASSRPPATVSTGIGTTLPGPWVEEQVGEFWHRLVTRLADRTARRRQ